MKKIFTLLIIFSIVVLPLGNLFGASYGTFTGITEGINFGPTFGIVPNPFELKVDLPVGIPLKENIDLWVSLSMIHVGDDGVNWEGVWVMPRYDFGKLAILQYNVLALNIGYPLNVSLQYHTEIGIIDEILSLEANLIGNLYSDLSLLGIVAPVLYFEKLIGLPLALYLELNASFEGVSTILGVDLILSKNFELNLGYDFGGTIVGWLSITF